MQRKKKYKTRFPMVLHTEPSLMSVLPLNFVIIGANKEDNAGR